MSRGPYVQLLTGTQWHFTTPQPDDVRLDDLGALAQMPRYSGATPGGEYHVAEHCVRVARFLRSCGAPPIVRKGGLLHDPEHVPPCDLPGPFVRHLERVERERRKVDPSFEDETLRIRRLGERAVWSRYGVLEVFDDPARAWPIWWADRVLLATERRDLMAPSEVDWGWMPDPLPERIVPWDSTRAWREFCHEFDTLNALIAEEKP